MRAAHGALQATAALLVIATLSIADQQSCGTVDTTDATVAAGDAPQTGTVTIDPCAREEAPLVIPAIGSIGGIGTFTASAPGAQEHPGTSEDGAFVATNGQTLAAGTYRFSSFTVPDGVTLRIATPASISTTGDFIVEGDVDVLAGGAFVVNALGSVVVSLPGGSYYDASIQTEAGVDTTFHVGGAFTVGPYGIVEVYTAPLSVYAHGAPPSAGKVAVRGPFGWLYDEHGALRISAAGDVELNYSESWAGPYEIRSFGGDVVFDDGSQVELTHGDQVPCSLVVEAAGSVRFAGSSYVRSAFAPLRVSAFGGDIEFGGGDGALLQCDARTGVSAGACRLRASGSIAATGPGRIQLAGAQVELTAAGGDVDVRVEELGIAGDAVTIHAAGSVHLQQSPGTTSIEAEPGPLEVKAFGGDVALLDESVVWVYGSGGTALVQASGAVRAAGGELGSDDARLSVHAGAGGISLDPCYVVTEATDVAIVAAGPVKLRRATAHSSDVRARNVLVASTTSYVDVVGCVVHSSFPAAGTPSGDVRIESWAGSAGTVDASRATIFSEDSTVASGDVLLRVVAAGGSPPRDSFLVPRSVKVKANAAAPERSSVTISGTYDLGSEVVDLTAPLTVHLGALDIDLPGLTTKNGRTFRHRDEQLDLLVKADPAATSRATFRLRRSGDLAGVLDPDGIVPLGLACGPSDARCAVRLVGGAFRLGKVRGALGEPALRVSGARVTLKGAGKDALVLDLGLALSTVTPATAADVTLAIGDDWQVVIPGDEFGRKRDRFTYRGDVSGIRSVVLDYAKERLTVMGRKMVLGALVGDDGLLTIRTTVDGEERAVLVRPRRKGAKLQY